ncbi:BRCA2-interacting transcriptional repressor EMSY isoform X1 [Odontomachus brunneus]|uniref:BRCA2-interacting transcriptional repressor EMSY isoform X1 n=1 Tax=Odontomachus brunneus TaxID=486640 RepID=UPI0013F22ABD|nr:BRCA2-interacting transcriptional repressor EMSY isoform X1 [Odontomachus brunneus]
MWPMRLEMTRDECRKCLRYLELDAYGSIISVLRAQGPFTSEKQKLLQEIAKMLNISNERHRAEVRRAVNDEKLATIAEQLNGPNTGTDWTIEGRRTIPLLPRLKARSTFTTLANSLSLAAAVANTRNPDRRITSGLSENFTAAESESQPEVKTEEDLPVDSKLCNLRNITLEPDDSKTLKESLNSIEDEKMVDNKDIDEKVTEKVTEVPKVSERLGKRKSPSPLPTALPNKVLVLSSDSPETLNHTVTDKTTSENDVQESQVITHHQNVKIIPLTIEISGSKESEVSGSTGNRPLVPANKQTSTIISACPSNANKPKTIVNFVQNKLSTKITPITSSDASNATSNKVQTENAETQSQDNAIDTQKTQKSESTSSSLSCIKRVPPIIHTNINPIVSKSVISSNAHRVMAVHPGTTVSSGPGPPQVKQATPLLTYKKWPSEQNATFSPQSTAKMSVTINSAKAVNIPHHSNTKLTAKTNVIVIQKGHAKGVTLSHAGKEVLGKVIMGGKNLCVASQHNASSVSVLPHHVSLNGDQTTTTLPTANPPNAESVKTNIKPGNTIVFNVRQDVFEKKKILSQHLDSSGVLNSEPKTVIQSRYTRLLTEDSNSDTNTTINKESSPKTDSVIISTEEEQHSKNEDVNASMTSQVVNSLGSSIMPEVKEILVKSTQLTSVQDNADNDTRTRKSNEDADMFDATLEVKDTNSESLQHVETVTVNHVDEHDNS